MDIISYIDTEFQFYSKYILNYIRYFVIECRRRKSQYGFVAKILTLMDLTWLLMCSCVGMFVGRYWPKVAKECRRKPKSIMLADKNAPNEEVWRQVGVSLLHSTLRESSASFILTNAIN